MWELIIDSMQNTIVTIPKGRVGTRRDSGLPLSACAFCAFENREVAPVFMQVSITYNQESARYLFDYTVSSRKNAILASLCLELIRFHSHQSLLRTC